MSDLLYSRDVLRLAADASGAGRLPSPTGSHMEHNPTCGDRTTVDVQVANGRIEAMAHDTKACVLAQASASILGGHLPGHALDDLIALRGQIVTMLAGGPSPPAPFGDYRALAEAVRFPARHRCLLLPVDAAIKAIEASQTTKPG